ncbi:E3 ubiquitin-protein ligase BRE1-like 2 isoform X2 [Cornus florida]|uniref:E3 ubiquitin-protein ligase BRE1-like 2 isoform X2 n=1 Tax=Cornus florida TaxID=4283 RepID=UPI0028A263BA|nr:E3 ubiquitin-protein ligase BRE1-like 2 isoform X2 [Cornus florida]
MENADSDEAESKKRPHFNSAMARHSSTSPDSKPVDAAVLQYENQKLVQQLDVQKHELQDLEAKIKELKDKQASYDDILITVNQLWNQLVDDLIFLGLRAGAGQNSLQTLDRVDRSRGSVPSCPAEEIFLYRLLETDSIGSNGKDGSLKYIEEALALRHSSTRELMKFLQDTVDAQRSKTESIVQALHGKLSAEDVIIELRKIDDLMKEEANHLHEVIDVLHMKHKEYTDGIQAHLHSHAVNQSEIKRLAGELEESMTELEESRRKLVNLKMRKDVASGVHTPVLGTINGSLSPEKTADITKGLRELKDSIEETKILAADRLSELQDAQEDNLILSKQLQDLQNELKDDKYVYSSRPYNLLTDQLQHWNAEVERYKALTDSLQADRSFVLRREKELNVKVESVDSARNAIDNTESKIEELELQLQDCIIEKNELEIKMEEALQDSAAPGRKDIKAEFHVMASALSKEMGMMEAQLNRWKETAHEALSLREEAESLKALLGRKTSEQKCMADKYAVQTVEAKSLKSLIEKMQKEKLELQILLDMLGQQIYDNRDLMEIKESEQRAALQAELLRNALNEHGLELRVKAANEAEAACQHRLSAAEAEIADLRAKLDASDRDVLELTEAIKIKDGEAEAYISEIETIGQAYEDMQTQNQHLLQQVTERDDYNIKLVSESVKMKQDQSFLLSEKQALGKQLQQVNMSLESLRTRISHSEEQMKVCLTEAMKSTEEDRHLAVNLETAKWEMADSEKELKWLKSAVASSEKENEQIQRKMEEIQMELDNESERKKLDEDLADLNRKVAEMSSDGGEAGIQKLQDEIKDCKAILKCGVCFDRPKEVVITKCYHLFCNPCIQRNLEIRHRKCPGCGTAFGQSDVRFVKI